MPSYSNLPGHGKYGFASLTVTTEADGLSDVIDLNGDTLSSIQMSTAWTDAAITFRGALDSTSNMMDVFTSTGLEVSYTTTDNRTLNFDPNFWVGIRFLQLRSGATGAAVAQGAARTIKIATRPLYTGR